MRVRAYVVDTVDALNALLDQLEAKGGSFVSLVVATPAILEGEMYGRYILLWRGSREDMETPSRRPDNAGCVGRMRNPHGYGVWTDRASGKTELERDTVQCRHCQTHIAVKPGSVCTVYLLPDPLQPGHFKEEAGAWCARCGGPICLRCHAQGVCIPFMRKIEAAEAQQRQFERLVLGR
jgi:hypothetical protein